MNRNDFAAAGWPIFQIDMPCPHCEYNLRGLAEARCPECGLAFDPVVILAQSEGRLKPPPPVWWTLANVLAHPVEFWHTPQVEGTSGPRGWYLCLVLGIAGLECGLVAGWAMILRSPVSPLALVGSVFVAGLAAVAGALAILFHTVLCLPAMPRKASPSVPTGATAVVGYASGWIIPTLMCSLAIPLSGAALPSRHAMVFGYALLLASCLMWLITLYVGAMVFAHGRRIAALWCAASNPFWYVIAWTLWMM